MVAIVPTMIRSSAAAGLMMILAGGLLLAGGWGCGDDSPPTFEDGLTAEEIIERAGGPLADDDPTAKYRIRSKESNPESGFEVTETTVVGEDLYILMFDEGEPRFESLTYGGEVYFRRYGSTGWERGPELDFSFSPEFWGSFISDEPIDEAEFESFIDSISRLSDSEIDGQRVMRVQLEMNFGPGGIPFLDYEAADDVPEELHIDPDDLPEEALPDEGHMTMVAWVAAEDFQVLRMETKGEWFIDGELSMEIDETTDLLEVGESVALPTPLPE